MPVTPALVTPLSLAAAVATALAAALAGLSSLPEPHSWTMPHAAAPAAEMPRAATPWSPGEDVRAGAEPVVRTASASVAHLSIPVTAVIPTRPAHAAYDWAVSTVETDGHTTVTRFAVD